MTFSFPLLFSSILFNLFASLSLIWLVSPRKRFNSEFGWKVLFVFAHPDDESMFFTPTIAHLASSGHECHLMCLSTGNFDRLGELRSRELLESARLLGISVENIRIIDDPRLQDGPKNTWPQSAIRELVSEYCTKHEIDSIITFDKNGVSNHPNHISTHYGVRSIKPPQNRLLTFYVLQSGPFVRKYIGVFDIVFSLLQHSFRVAGRSILLTTRRPWLTLWTMQAHASQLVWFRYLSILFSRFTYMNTLLPTSFVSQESNVEEEIQLQPSRIKQI